ncbi:MAG: alpha/beta fold hydrolase [Propionicimonas sp.]
MFMGHVWRLFKRLLVVSITLLLVIMVAVAILAFTPILDASLKPRPAPLTSYSTAAWQIDKTLAEETELPLLAKGGSIALLTGARTPIAVVIFHGYTNTPDEFRVLAKAYRDQGYNVWVPRWPHHGLADKMTSDFSLITSEELRVFADRSIDIAAGLGDEVMTMGISGGGTLAMWSGLERREVTRTVMISPLLSPGGFPRWAVPPLARVLRVSPVDFYRWWAPEKAEANVAGMIYPRYSLKGIAALLELRVWTESRLEHETYPVDGSILLLGNDGDPSIDHEFNEAFAARLVPPERLSLFRIPASAGLSHDIVCPDPELASDAQVTEAYRQLSMALELKLPDPLATR